ncbi:hypothetical protein [Cyanobium gracile]|uniref:HEAT repeat domain-containing protein n=1 Tax=Cyanobium gracile UHCC 0281 TaxID=3110309 RepID=A0ABU5SVB8_9CYAN|nr:hypothetical protein [Cyanobium gracile]MEA5442429.1 hypothetical protein [Cyanobium gracile UHCC 0281]
MTGQPPFLALPQHLPPAGSPDRWPWLRRLRAQDDLDLEPWLEAIEGHGLVPDADLLAALAGRLDGAAASRLLAWWLAESDANPALLNLIGRIRDRRCRALLRQALRLPGEATDARAAAGNGAIDRMAVLLPLLGHQRDPEDFQLLRQRVLAPLPLQQRRAALEGLAVGLAAWPAAPLRQTLRQLIGDLDPALAATAVDLLARLPAGRGDLADLDRGRLAPELARRVERRLAGAGVDAVDGRSWGSPQRA